MLLVHSVNLSPEGRPGLLIDNDIRGPLKIVMFLNESRIGPFLEKAPNRLPGPCQMVNQSGDSSPHPLCFTPDSVLGHLIRGYHWWLQAGRW